MLAGAARDSRPLQSLVAVKYHLLKIPWLPYYFLLIHFIHIAILYSFYRKDALLKKHSPHRAVQEIHNNVEVCDCTAIATLNNHILLHGDEGWVGTIPTKFLLVGLSVSICDD